MFGKVASKNKIKIKIRIKKGIFFISWKKSAWTNPNPYVT